MLTIEREAAAWHDAMQVGVMGHGRAPGMQHGGEPQACPEVFGIGPDGEQGLGGGFEQEVVDNGLVLIGEVADLSRHREHNVEVRDRQEFCLACGEPLSGHRTLALWAVPVAAGNGVHPITCLMESTS